MKYIPHPANHTKPHIPQRMVILIDIHMMQEGNKEIIIFLLEVHSIGNTLYS